MTQTFEDFEHICVDDGSTEDVKSIVEGMGDEKFRYIRQEHQGRVIARNTGIAVAKGEWLCWLDSDDCYDPMYLATFKYYINENPDVRVWLCGVVVHGVKRHPVTNVRLVPVWTKIRPANVPPLSEDGTHHLHFDSGTIGTGMFVYHREAMEKIGPMPPWVTMYDISDGCNEWLGYQTPYSAAKKWTGNPYGCDWVYIRKLSMFYRIYAIEAALYVQYIR
jgi:glycosyltransferase involved in cell wall biosynthesis